MRVPIAKVVRKINVKDQPREADYWRAQPPAARLAALEQIRREYHLWKGDVDPGLQRVYRIVKRA
jgi:hypothetical protein